MITDDVIKEVYRRFEGQIGNRSNLNIDYFMGVLSSLYSIERDKERLIVNDLGEKSFKVVLIKAIRAILEFDRYVAIVLRNHIIFFDKYQQSVNIHFRYDDMEETKPKRSLFKKLFGKKN